MLLFAPVIRNLPDYYNARKRDSTRACGCFYELIQPMMSLLFYDLGSSALGRAGSSPVEDRSVIDTGFPGNWEARIFSFSSSMSMP